MEDEVYLDLLEKYWGYKEFRGIQLDIIKSIGAGLDTLGLMPTGGGKSITFQVSSLAKPGVCLVITPLVALMKDQVNNLRKRQIRATAIYSGMSREQIVNALENCIYGDYKFLYISPERLTSELFLQKLKHIDVNFITVDEAHCISQWGYDFRPSYLSVAKIRDLLPNIPILALTATATLRVVDDIQEQLQFKEKNVFRMSFKRANLAYIVRKIQNKEDELLHLLKNTIGSTIIYVRSRRQAREIAEYLNKSGISALFYHAGLNSVDKDFRQNAWQNDKARVIVATNAFGMGIDKSNVRWVIHMNVPDSLEAYFQEAGRAGRDGEKAAAIMLYNHSDCTKLKMRISANFPEKKFICRVYDSLCYFYQIALGAGSGATFEFDLKKFCLNYKFFPVQVESALRILTNAGFIEYKVADEAQSRVLFLLTKEELYRINTLSEHAELVIRQLMRNYGGIFCDYVSFNEKRLVEQLQLDEEEVYEILKGLSRQRFIDYIPCKHVPRIVFKESRILGEELVLKSNVYDDRKREYEARISAMIHYAEEEKLCRSEILLSYFGEEASDSCGVCDVCLQNKEEETDSAEKNAIKEVLMTFVADGERHLLEDLRQYDFDQNELGEVLEELVQEGILLVECNEIWLNNKR